MPRREPPAVDDAGNEIRPLDLRDLRGDGDKASAEIRLLVKRLNKSVRFDGNASNRGQIMVIPASIGMVVLWLMLRGGFAIPPLLALPSFLALLVVISVVSRLISSRVGRRIRRGGIARTVASHGFCGGCGYDLRRPTQTATATVVCSECGAQWSCHRLRSAPLGRQTWDPLGKGKGRVSQRTRLCNDDRGALFRRMCSLRQRAPKAGRQLWSSEHRDAIRRIRLTSGLWLRFCVGAIGLACIGFALWYLIVSVQQDDAAFGLSVASLPGTIGVVILIAVWMSELGVRNAPFVRRVRDAGLCPACATPLGTETHDGDGYCVCAACGLSWMPER